MSKYILFTAEYWQDTAERVLATAAQSVVAVIGVDQVLPNAFTLDYKVLAGVAAGGALAALVKSLAKLGATAQVPTSKELEDLKTAVTELKRSGGDVEAKPLPSIYDYDYQAAPGVAPIAASAPVTDETMGLD